MQCLGSRPLSQEPHGTQSQRTNDENHNSGADSLSDACQRRNGIDPGEIRLDNVVEHVSGRSTESRGNEKIGCRYTEKRIGWS